MTPEEVEEFQSGLVSWSDYRGSQPCPKCGELNRMQVRQEFKTSPVGSYSLAGVQMKFSGQVVWVYRCQECGAHGSAEPH